MLKNILFGFIFCFAAALSAFGQSPVWKVESDDSVLYIGGTCHVLRKSDYPLPKEFDQAYDDADIIVFETDVQDMSKPEAMQAMMSKGTYYGGKTTLKDVLSSKVYASLEQYCYERGISIYSLNQFKPSMAMMTLMNIELMKIGANQAGVDDYFYQKAINDNRAVETLETIYEQIDLITSMGAGNENNFVIYSIRDLRNLKEEAAQLIDAWRIADEEKLDELFLEELRIEFPRLYRTMLSERNKKWLLKIEDYIQTPEREFILVGAAHLIGQDGIITQLKRKGYAVIKLR